MSYVPPENVHSPKSRWTLVDVLLDRRANNCAYALGLWDGERVIGFRWNGDEDNRIGNPQSRGLPTWIILDGALYPAVLELKELTPEKREFARGFLSTGGRLSA